MSNLKKLFDYQLNNENDCCDISTQLSIQYILSSTQINFFGYSILGPMNLAKKEIRHLMKQIYIRKFDDKFEDRAIGALMGLAVGDALGAPLEFRPLQYNKIILKDMIQLDNKFPLKPGQWTDDTSMALCLCDSLLEKNTFDPIDSMLRYLNWWYQGYNNATMFDNLSANHNSIGLGGNISLSFDNFLKKGNKFTTAGNDQTSGNGSLMRLAPIAIAYYLRPKIAQLIAKQSSYVTHRGDEAAECCSLLVSILIDGITTGNKLSKELSV